MSAHVAGCALITKVCTHSTSVPNCRTLNNDGGHRPKGCGRTYSVFMTHHEVRSTKSHGADPWITRALDWLQGRPWTTGIILVGLGLLQGIWMALTFRALMTGNQNGPGDPLVRPDFGIFFTVMPVISSLMGLLTTAVIVGLLSALVAQYGMNKDGIFRGISSTVFSLAGTTVVMGVGALVMTGLAGYMPIGLPMVFGLVNFLVGVGIQIAVVGLDVKGRRLREARAAHGT